MDRVYQIVRMLKQTVCMDGEYGVHVSWNTVSVYDLNINLLFYVRNQINVSTTSISICVRVKKINP